MRISDWSSDVCSSDLARRGQSPEAVCAVLPARLQRRLHRGPVRAVPGRPGPRGAAMEGLVRRVHGPRGRRHRSEEHPSELQSLMRISYAVFCLKKKNKILTWPKHTTMLHSKTLTLS